MATPESPKGAAISPVDATVPPVDAANSPVGALSAALQTLYQSNANITPESLATILVVMQAFNSHISNSVYQALGGGACGAPTVRHAACVRRLRPIDKMECLESLAVFAGTIQNGESEDVVAKTIEDRVAHFKNGYFCGYHLHGDDPVTGTKRNRDDDDGMHTPSPPSSTCYQRSKSKFMMPSSLQGSFDGLQRTFPSNTAKRTPPSSASHRRNKSKSKRQSPWQPSSDGFLLAFPFESAESSAQKPRVEMTFSSKPLLLPASDQPTPQQTVPPSPSREIFDRSSSSSLGSIFSRPTTADPVFDNNDAGIGMGEPCTTAPNSNDTSMSTTCNSQVGTADTLFNSNDASISPRRISQPNIEDPVFGTDIGMDQSTAWNHYQSKEPWTPSQLRTQHWTSAQSGCSPTGAHLAANQGMENSDFSGTIDPKMLSPFHETQEMVGSGFIDMQGWSILEDV